jgi:hypothetical protein
MNYPTKKFICKAKCPELDSYGGNKCIATVYNDEDVMWQTCPCGNVPSWHKIESEATKNE